MANVSISRQRHLVSHLSSWRNRSLRSIRLEEATIADCENSVIASCLERLTNDDYLSVTSILARTSATHAASFAGRSGSCWTAGLKGSIETYPAYPPLISARS